MSNVPSSPVNLKKFFIHIYFIDSTSSFIFWNCYNGVYSVFYFLLFDINAISDIDGLFWKLLRSIKSSSLKGVNLPEFLFIDINSG